MKNTRLLEELEKYRFTCGKEEREVTETLKKKHGDVFAYGSTPEKTFLELVKTLTIKPKRLIVVGCSIGWINFYWNELYPNIETIGIDIHSYRIKFGSSLIEKYNLNNITLCEHSFYDFNFQEGDLIWESNLCFRQNKIYVANDAIIKKIPNIGIISYRPITMNVKNRKYINSYVFPVSWNTNQSFYIYENL